MIFVLFTVEIRIFYQTKKNIEDMISCFIFNIVPNCSDDAEKKPFILTTKFMIPFSSLHCKQSTMQLLFFISAHLSHHIENAVNYVSLSLASLSTMREREGTFARLSFIN